MSGFTIKPTGENLREFTLPDKDGVVGMNEDISQVFVSGVKKINVKEYYGTATVNNGTATFNLTTDGTATGPAIFTSVYSESVSIRIFDSSNSYVYDVPVISANKKTLSVSINKLGSVIVGVIQFITAANGVTCYIQIKGE